MDRRASAASVSDCQDSEKHQELNIKGQNGHDGKFTIYCAAKHLHLRD